MINQTFSWEFMGFCLYKWIKYNSSSWFYNKSSIEEDIAKLINAYNLVGSVSSFCAVCLMMNENIINYYEYDIYRKVEKYRHMHHECFRYPRKFKIYQMKPSNIYQGEMYFWGNTKDQVKLMLEEKCNFSEFKLLSSQ